MSSQLLVSSSATIVVISGNVACSVPAAMFDSQPFDAVLAPFTPASIDAIHRDEITHSLNESRVFHVTQNASAISSAIEFFADASFSSAHDSLNPVCITDENTGATAENADHAHDSHACARLLNTDETYSHVFLFPDRNSFVSD